MRQSCWPRRTCSIVAIIIAGFLGLGLALAGATVAASRTPGERITLAPGCDVEGYIMTFPANTPFHVFHGFTWIPGEDSAATQAGVMRPTTHFELFVEGVRSPSMPYIYYDQTKGYGGKANLTSYPDGLAAGTYLFEGRWYKDGSLVGGAFGESVQVLECQMIVVFGP